MKNSLAEFFRKTREFYPDSSIHIDAVFVSGDRLIGEWTYQTTIAEPFFGGQTRKVLISLHGASVLRTENGKITDWTDYYDGLTSRRTALAAHLRNPSNSELFHAHFRDKSARRMLCPELWADKIIETEGREIQIAT